MLFLHLFLIETNFIRTFHFLDRRPKTTTTTTTTTTTVTSTKTKNTSTTTSNSEDDLKLGCSEEKVRGVLWPATKVGEVSQMACPNGTSGEPLIL